jgi:hypothetical protein
MTGACKSRFGVLALDQVHVPWRWLKKLPPGNYRQCPGVSASLSFFSPSKFVNPEGHKGHEEKIVFPINSFCWVKGDK